MLSYTDVDEFKKCFSSGCEKVAGAVLAAGGLNVIYQFINQYISNITWAVVLLALVVMIVGTLMVTS